MKRLLFGWLEPLIQAAITNRIILFHEAMVRRGQIARGAPELPQADPR